MSINLKKLVSEAVSIGTALSGAVPVVSNVVQLASLLSKISGDLSSIPADPSTGQPLTLEAAEAHLAVAQQASATQDDSIRQQAEQALHDNNG